jgi:hypothetical protein
MMFVIEVGVSVFYAFATLVVGWTGIALVVCAAVGAALRLRCDRESSIFLGSIAAGLILLVDAVLIGIEISQEVAIGGDDPLPPYLIVMMPAIAWLIHLPMGLWVLRLGVKALEVLAAWLARRQGRSPNLPT